MHSKPNEQSHIKQNKQLLYKYLGIMRLTSTWVLHVGKSMSRIDDSPWFLFLLFWTVLSGSIYSTMCWLHSMSIFLVIQELDTLNLGGNHVRVMCERVWRIQVFVHSKSFSRLELTSDSRLMTRQNTTCVKHARSWRVTIAEAL